MPTEENQLTLRQLCPSSKSVALCTTSTLSGALRTTDVTLSHSITSVVTYYSLSNDSPNCRQCILKQSPLSQLRRAFEEVEKRTSGQSESLAPERLILENIRKTHERAEAVKADKAAQEALARKRQEEEEEEDSGPFRRRHESSAAKNQKAEGFDELAAGVQTLAAEVDMVKREEFGYLGAKGDVAIGALIAEVRALTDCFVFSFLSSLGSTPVGGQSGA